MAAPSYDRALSLLLAHEGGYTNDPQDPGGPTNFGITIYDARRYAAEFGWISGRTVAAADVKAMPLWFAKKVYKAKYWDSQRLDQMEPGVDYALFDYGVNSGVGRSGRVLRRMLHLPDTSSEVTPAVLEVANRAFAADLVRMICDERLIFLHGLKTWPRFGGGWGRRVGEVRTYGLKIAQDLPIVGAPPLAPASGRAIDPDKFAKVRALQKMLSDAGFDPGAIDGDMGTKTVKAFQRYKGMALIDGVVGSRTRPMLDAVLAVIPPLPALV